MSVFYLRGKGGSMRKHWYRRILIMILILVPIIETNLCIEKLQKEAMEEQVSTSRLANETVIPGGMPIGIYMKTDGVLVLNVDEVIGKDGKEYAPAKNLIKEGDYIVAFNGKKISTKQGIMNGLEESGNATVTLKLRRGGEIIEVCLQPVLCEDEKYRMGMWVRDSVQGLGTVTYLTTDKEFAALGHGIHDSDTNDLLEMKYGKIYETKILRIKKGERGNPGGMEGVIVYNRFNMIGHVDKNTEAGIYGTVDNLERFTDSTDTITIGEKKDVEIGPAVIRCTLDGVIEEFDAEIVKINYFAKEANKGMTIEVTDERLLEKTGGIVQGMSGSPIIQDGKLVGAVTHVLVNDPTRGYGIFIENMLDAAK